RHRRQHRGVAGLEMGHTGCDFYPGRDLTECPCQHTEIFRAPALTQPESVQSEALGLDRLRDARLRICDATRQRVRAECEGGPAVRHDGRGTGFLIAHTRILTVLVTNRNPIPSM